MTDIDPINIVDSACSGDATAPLPEPAPEPTPAELDDTAAELDDEIPADALDDPDDDEQDDPPRYTGMCFGGPYDGRVMVSRYPQGFWLVDKVNRLVWVYTLDGDRFTCREGAPAPLVDDVRMGVAEGAEFDVLAYDTNPVAP